MNSQTTFQVNKVQKIKVKNTLEKDLSAPISGTDVYYFFTQFN